ncbi:PREDICTED: endoplasmic reticulum resident protein 44-like isoform X4 [Branchiostoma belcheri]|uniref:Endoplasmic reticulum resident protein 44-like isoform X4 n=1 Tax=Branchiostoma belcheri TaxID=7741 RepID=A0A6P4ZVU2_BRABE|nr:PREDICTED: endoplasmic reticulum resident protein 44-like isoform X4 [Branchiostoma belcheri]
MDAARRLMSFQFTFFLFYLQAVLFGNPTDTRTVPITVSNLEDVLNHNELVFVNFYADWCRFSKMLEPVFEEASNTVPTAIQNVVFGKVNCDAETEVAQKFGISKYPTLKLFRNGRVQKREYRGQRSVEAFKEYIEEQMKSNIKQVNDLKELNDIDSKKRNIIGYFNSMDSPEYKTFQQVASNLRDDCDFTVAVGEISKKERLSGDNIIFRPPRTKDQDMVYLGSLVNKDLLTAWSTDKCVPLVREITFENGEELTEEGLPFLILFHNPEDAQIVQKFNQIVSRELLHEKGNINFLIADGTKFTHPLHHLGKSTKDLPVLAIDSFRHMYLFPDISQMSVPGKLKQFCADLHSGKLHREFHHGPDPTQPPQIAGQDQQQQQQQQQQGGGTAPQEKRPTTPPESQFIKLAPSKNRYTLLRDEL